MYSPIFKAALLGSVALRMMMDGDAGGSPSAADPAASPSATDAPAPASGTDGSGSAGDPNTAPSAAAPPSPADAPDLPDPAPAPARKPVEPRKGDKVILHGRALIDGLQEAEATVTGVSAGNKIVASVARGSGRDFDVPGVASFGPTDDQSNWWEWPKDADGNAIVPTRDDPDVDQPASAP